MGSKETPIQKAILGLLAGIFPAPEFDRCFWRQNTGGAIMTSPGSRRFVTFARAGTPDIFIFHHGLLTCIEVKSADGKLSKDQRAYCDWLERQHGRYIVARSVDEAISGLVAAGVIVQDKSGAISRT